MNKLQHLQYLNFKKPSRYADNITAIQAKPSLDLNFARNKTLMDNVTGNNLVTFTRASSGTYVDSQGVIKTATTNLLLQSEDFATTWVNTNSSETTNAIAAPNGTVTADLLLADGTTTSSARSLRQNVNSAVASVHTFSFYAKAKDGNFVACQFRNAADTTSFCAAEFNISNGTVSTAASNGGNATGATTAITALGNGWYRCSVSGTADTSGTQLTVIITGRTISNNNTVAANTELVYLWGAQLEQSSTVGEYIPTTSTINSAPRFDHNPITGESLGLLVEESRANLLLRSEEFGTTWTTLNASISADQITAPGGTLTSDKLIETASTGAHYVTQAVSALTGVYTVSVFIKAAEISYAMILMVGGTTQRGVGFNLTTGSTYAEAIGGVSPPDIGASAVSVGDGWWRCRMTWTADGQTALRIYTDSGTGTGSTTGTGTSGIYIWGAQLEAGAFPTSYIPTTTATVTRAADVASISGSNFSSWYRQDEGTVFADASSRSSSAANAFVLQIDDNSSNNTLRIYHQTDEQAIFQVRTSGASRFATGFGALTDGVAYKTSAMFKSGDNAAVLNGGSITANSTAWTSSSNFTRLVIGNSQATEILNGTIRRLTYFPQRISNENLQRITQ